MRTASTSSSPPTNDRLVRIPLERLHAHPSNANLMSGDRLEKLARNIEREGRYPPLIVRPHPTLTDAWQILDGHQRCDVLRRLGHSEAVCFVWPCDDATALLLLATLNRLEGDDVPVRRAELLAELTAAMPRELAASLLPEDAATIDDTLALLDLDPERLLAELTAAAERHADDAPRLISFALRREDEQLVERAIAEAMSGLEGRDRRGRALAAICGIYLERGDA